MKNTLRRVLLALLFATGPALAVVCYFLATRPLPKPMLITVQLPERAEVRPADAVTPGTFKIESSISEILNRARTSTASTLVSWGTLLTNSNCLHVNYWFPRGDSTFLHARRVEDINWPAGITTETMTMTRNGVVVTPMHYDGWFTITSLGLMAYFFILAMLGVNRYTKRQEAQAAHT